MRNVMMKMMMMISCVALLMMKMMISYFSLLMAPVADEILLLPYIFVFYTTPLRGFAGARFQTDGANCEFICNLCNARSIY